MGEFEQLKTPPIPPIRPKRLVKAVFERGDDDNPNDVVVLLEFAGPGNPEAALWAAMGEVMRWPKDAPGAPDSMTQLDVFNNTSDAELARHGLRRLRPSLDYELVRYDDEEIVWRREA